MSPKHGVKESMEVNRVWVITGTSSGMGRSLVDIALSRGDCVVATARSLDAIRELTTNPETADRVHIMSLDVTAPFSDLCVLAAEAVVKWGRVDVLVNNAGVGMLGITEEVGLLKYGLTLALRVDGYQTQFNTNFFGPLNVTNAFLPYLRARRQGTIVFVGSRSSWRSNVAMLGTYAASKAALGAMAEALSVELAPLNIKVLHVLPGGMRTQNWNKMTLLPTAQVTSSRPIAKKYDAVGDTHFRFVPSIPGFSSAESASKLSTNGHEGEVDMRLADYEEHRNRQIEWMRDVRCDNDPEKCAHVLYDVVADNTGPPNDGAEGKDGRERGWPELNMLVLGADAETNIRDKCHAVLRNLDEWRDVVRGVAADS